MLLTFLLGLSGCSGSTSADARVNDHPNEADEELHVLTIGTADSGGTMYPVGSALASVLSGHDEQLKVNLSASNGSYTNVENIKNGQFQSKHINHINIHKKFRHLLEHFLRVH